MWWLQFIIPQFTELHYNTVYTVYTIYTTYTVYLTFYLLRFRVEMTIKYNKDITDRLLQDYQAGIPVEQIALNLAVPERSVIAKLASLGVYKKKSYVNKNGETPVKKEVYIEKIAELLNTNIELLESLEKVNKRVLVMISSALEKTQDTIK